MPRRLRAAVMLLVTFLLLLTVGLPGYAARWRPANSDVASSEAPSATWVVVGDFQNEASACDDWYNTCANTTMEDDDGDGVYRFMTDTLPAGTYNYKVVESGNWANAHPAANVAFTATASSEVRWYFLPGANRVADNVNQCIATVAGSFQDQLGGGNWAPSNLRTMMWQSAPGSDWYEFSANIPAGDWAYKVARDEGWVDSYPNDNVALSLTEATEMLFRYNCATNEVEHSVNTPPVTNWVVVGDFQNEASACDDWNNACANTTMEDDDGDGVYRFITDTLPAGTYNYKVVESGNWDNAHPAANVAFAATDGSEVRWYFLPGANHVADNLNQCIATVAGSFQDQLGGGNWAPSNLRSMMWQSAPGSDWYEFTANIPAGEWEYKVARDEGWTDSYPSSGNVSLSLALPSDVTFAYNCATNEVSHTVSNNTDAELAQPVLQHPVQDDVLYFLIPDRFNDGDSTNNCGDYAGSCVDNDTQANVLTHGYLANDRGYYHGGDIQGLIAKLDYLEDMGVTAIWVGPIFKNKPVQEDSSNLYGHSSGYHGYWITDFMNVDPHLGTNAEFQSLVTQAHSRGINVFMDIITNHTADVIKYAENDYSYRNKTDFPWVDTSGNSFDDLDFAYYGQADYNFPEMDVNGFPWTPSIPPAEQNLKNPAWLNDPLNYHNRGNTSFTGENSIYGDFFGLDDLFTARKEVVDGMIDIYKHWIDTYGVDGFRIDTTKHVNIEFWQVFGPEIQAAAEAQGIDHFFAFGEVYDQQYGPSFLSEFSTKGKLQSTVDFAFQLEARDFASKSEPTDKLKSFFENDDYYIDADSNAYAMPTFIGNHDMGRIGYFLAQDNAGAADDELLARSQLAHALMFFARGQPVIYYGDEQGFVGDGGDKLARQDMFPSQVSEYNDDDLIGSDATTADDNFDATHPLYQSMITMTEVYSDHVALRRGAQLHRYSSNAAGIYAFSRINRDEKVEYVVAFNNAESDSSANVPTFYAAGTQFDLILSPDDASAASLTTDASGNLPVTVPALGVVIYKASTTIPTSDAAPSISIGNLSNDQQVELTIQSQDGHEVLQRLEVSAELGSTIFAEVTFAVKASDAPTYTVMGVDDNAPYRVFYDISDASDLPDGTTLDFKVIVNDLHGHYSSASVTGIAPTVQQAAASGPAYAVIHYYRADGDYGDHTTGDFNDFWGLHLWGDAIDDAEGTTWDTPKPFLGEDEYGRFAWIKLKDPTQELNFIIHRGNTKDGTEDDRSFNPTTDGAQIWTKQDDGSHYSNQAAAQGVVTIHYQRPGGDYGDYNSDDYNDFWGLHLWNDGGGLDWTTPKKADGQDEYGVYFTIALADYAWLDFSKPLNFIVHKGDVKDPDNSPDRTVEPAQNASIWLKQDDVTVHASRGSAENYAILHYHRPAGDYGDYSSDDFNDYWGLHDWQDVLTPTDAVGGWSAAFKPTFTDTFGVAFKVELIEDAAEMGYIFHKGDTKDPGSDQFLTFATHGYEVWQVQDADPEDPYILPILSGAAACAPDISLQTAHWLTQDTIAWNACDASATYQLHYAPNGGMTLDNNAISGGNSIALTVDAGGLSSAITDKFPHLVGYRALKIAAGDLALVPEILKGQLLLSSSDADGNAADATGIQIPGVLDDLYASNAMTSSLGVVFSGTVPTLTVWAPTAKSVTLHRFADSISTTTSITAAMTLDSATGVWSITGDASWKNQFYLYEVEVYVNSTGQVERNLVTDPYALSLSMNSLRSQIVDLNDATLKPTGWDTLTKPALAAPEDAALYELHVRDFSVNDATVPESHKGKFSAFTQSNSQGMAHLRNLAQAGLTHIHLLPAFDIATIDENEANRQEVDWATLSGYAPDSEQQQAAIDAIRDQDGFNWGYDPFHYTVPEGSYSSDPDGATRILEFREMVKALNDNGLRVVMDVVYNHTNASGQADKSVLDKVVPGYYHRLDGNGNVTTSTCCQNTATEHAMMEKLMVDSLATWATAYKVDGFRFDLMGHHMVSNMVNVRDRLHALTPATDGVNGSNIYLYGEGWNFGEVADGARGQNATQLNVGGLGIGTFNDRLRDAVRGGGPFDGGETLKLQGFINGLAYDSNDLDQGDQRAKLLLYQDQIRVGLAGNLADYAFTDRNGNQVTGAQVDYNGAPAGYTQDPQEHIIYASAHDNQTLFDAIQYKAPLTSTMDARARMQNMGLSVVCLSQGVPFFHAGSEMLRSKSLDRNSYNSGDWFNRLFFDYSANNWGVGVPPAADNQADWPIMKPLLANAALNPTQADIMKSVNHVQECLKIRKSSPLFRLQSAQEVQNRVQFHNTGATQVAGLIAMSISDKVGTNLDGTYEQIVVLFNANDEAQPLPIAALTGISLQLHPLQAASTDAVVKTASFNSATGTFTIPGRTTAVFVELAPPAPPGATYGVELSAIQENSGFSGSTLTYQVDVKNTGNVADTFNLTVSGNWAATVSPSSVMLAAGESKTVLVNVAIPANATHGSSDTTTVTAVSVAHSTVRDTMGLNTTAMLPTTPTVIPPTATPTATPQPTLTPTPIVGGNDGDNDGVDNATENGVPNPDGSGTGDGNGDGIPDSQQHHVNSLPNQGSGNSQGYVTFEVPVGIDLVDLMTPPAPAQMPEGVTHMPQGMFEFKLSGFNSQSVMVNITLHAGETPDTYYKHDENSETWYEFLYDETTGAVISDDGFGNTIITLHFVDGGRGDADGVVNGVINDPGAPAMIVPPTSVQLTNLDGQTAPDWPFALLATLGLAVGVGLWHRRRK